MKVDFVLILIILLFIIGSSAALLLIEGIFNDLGSAMAYSEYCNFHDKFCYCEKFIFIPISCGFNLESSISCINGVCSDHSYSNDTKAICDIAKKYNDKSVMFGMECP